jgi:chromosome segregation ATPase
MNKACVRQRTEPSLLADYAESMYSALPNAIRSKTKSGSVRNVQLQGAITMSRRDAYIETMKTQLDELNAKMGKLEDKAKEAKKEAREKYTEEMNKLRQQSKLAIDKLDELKTSGEDSWDVMTAEMEKIRDAFIHSFSYFKSQL